MEKLVSDLWKANMKHPQASEDVNKDVISHFVLRLVYCRLEELRKWFLSMETALFRYCFRLESSEAQRAILAEFDLPYKAVSSTEFEVVSLVVTQFRSHISKALILTNRKWMSSIREQEKDRLTPVVEALCKSYLGPDYSQLKEFGEISIKDIDEVAKSSFPMFTRHLFEKLREDHHLKHGGRMQLGLFLKGVGLKLDDALAFWKAEFSQSMVLCKYFLKVGSERFDKEYAYSIRHLYGREGKRTDYTPYSCQKVIAFTPGAGDHHGCPYRHFSEENLRAALGGMGVSTRGVEDVMDKVRNRHY